MKNFVFEEFTISLIVPLAFAVLFSNNPLKVGEKISHYSAANNAEMMNASGSIWKIKEGYEINFSMKGAEGNFNGLRGEISFDENDLSTAHFEVSVEVVTISTGNDKMEEHARGKKWLDAVSFPKINFISSSIKPKGTGYEVTGMLDLRGVKKEITFPFTFSKDGNDGLFEGSFKINREDYGIEGPFMAFMVGEEVTINLKIPVSR